MGTSFLLRQSCFFRIICVRRPECAVSCWLLLPPKSWRLCVTVGSLSFDPLAPKVPLRYLVALKTWSFESSPVSLSGQVFLLVFHLQIDAAFLCFFVFKCWLSGFALLTAVCTPSSLHSQQLFCGHFIILDLNIHHLYALSLLLSLLEKDHFVGGTLAVTC